MGKRSSVCTIIGTNASTALGVEHHEGVPGTYEVLTDETPIAELVQASPEARGLWVLPATIDLAGAEIGLAAAMARESRLLHQLQAFTAAHSFDYVFIDCPPSLGLLTINAFVAAQEVLIPIQCEYYALEGLGHLLQNVDRVRQAINPSLHVSSIVLVMYDARTRLAEEVASEVRSHFPDVVCRTVIPRSVRLSEAPSFGLPINRFDPGSRGAIAYRLLAEEIRHGPSLGTCLLYTSPSPRD